MPIKPPNAPDYACKECGHQFSKNILGKALGLALDHLGDRKSGEGLKCPKCGSSDIGMLVY